MVPLSRTRVRRPTPRAYYFGTRSRGALGGGSAMSVCARWVFAVPREPPIDSHPARLRRRHPHFYPFFSRSVRATSSLAAPRLCAPVRFTERYFRRRRRRRRHRRRRRATEDCTRRPAYTYTYTARVPYPAATHDAPTHASKQCCTRIQHYFTLGAYLYRAHRLFS